MRLASFLFTVAYGAAPRDPCTELCNRNGPAVCTGGSWTKPDGTCQAYLYRGDPSGSDYCYHTAASAATCPGRGRSVRAADVARLLGGGADVAPPAPATTTRAPVTAPAPIAGPPVALADDRLASLLAVFGIHEVEQLCGFTDALPDIVIGAVAGRVSSGLPQAAYWDRIKGAQFLAMASVPSSCQMALVKNALVLAIGVGAPAGLPEFCTQNAVAIRRLFEQDLSFQPGFGPFAQVAVATVTACPAIVDARARTDTLNRWIAGLRAGFPAVNPVQLHVSRARTFSDSLGFLNGAAGGLMSGLPRIVFNGEPGWDAGGLGRDWLSLVTRRAFASDSTDPLGGLFEAKPDTDFVQLKMERPFTAATRPSYFAIGRLLAMSVIQRLPLGVPLPRMFFSRLLDLPVTVGDVLKDDPDMHRVMLMVHRGGAEAVRAALLLEDDDPVPTPDAYIATLLNELFPAEVDERIAVIREGFSSVLPVAAVHGIVSADDLRSAIFGAPEISVDDLMAHTNYDPRYFTAASPQIQWLWAWLRRSDNDVRRKFLRFVTGLSQLPVEGMVGLRYRLYITGPSAADLGPRSHTCSFGLDLPIYRNAAELEEYMGAAVSSDGFGMA